MKKSLLISAVVGAIVLTGCSKSETIVTDFDQPNAISFENYMHKSTRATEVVASDLVTNGFTVSAYHNAVSPATAAWIFENLDVNYNSTNSNYSTEYYWPTTGTMDFYAVYTSDQSVDITSESKSFSYTVADGTVDLVTAKKTGESCATHSSTKSNVALAFNHALSQIYFSAKTENENYYCQITKIEVICNKTATFTFANEGDAFGTATTSNTYDYVTDYSTDIDGTDAVVGTKAGNSLMLIPQNGATIKVYYKSFDAETDALLKDFSTAETCKSYTVTSAWTAGTTIKYAMTLPAGANPIEFTASVTAWTSPETTTDIEF